MHPYNILRFKVQVFWYFVILVHYIYNTIFDTNPKLIESYIGNIEERQKNSLTWKQAEYLKGIKCIYRELKSEVDRLHQLLKDHKVFLLNTNMIDVDIYKQFGIQKLFNCKYRGDGELSRHKPAVKINYNGEKITVTSKDVVRAFQLGADSFEDVCQVIQKFGSIEAIL